MRGYACKHRAHDLDLWVGDAPCERWYCWRMDTSALLKQAQTDLAFALAQGDGYAEDAAAERIRQFEAELLDADPNEGLADEFDHGAVYGGPCGEQTP